MKPNEINIEDGAYSQVLLSTYNYITTDMKKQDKPEILNNLRYICSFLFAHHPSLSTWKYRNRSKMRKDLFDGNTDSYSYYLKDVFDTFYIKFISSNLVNEIKNSWVDDLDKMNTYRIKIRISELIRESLYEIIPSIKGYSIHMKDLLNFNYRNDAKGVDLCLCLHIRGYVESVIKKSNEKMIERGVDRYNKNYSVSTSNPTLELLYDVVDDLPVVHAFIHGNCKSEMKKHIEYGFKHQWVRLPKIGKNGNKMKKSNEKILYSRIVIENDNDYIKFSDIVRKLGNEYNYIVNNDYSIVEALGYKKELIMKYEKVDDSISINDKETMKINPPRYKPEHETQDITFYQYQELPLLLGKERNTTRNRLCSLLDIIIADYGNIELIKELLSEIFIDNNDVFYDNMKMSVERWMEVKDNKRQLKREMETWYNNPRLMVNGLQ